MSDAPEMGPAMRAAKAIVAPIAAAEMTFFFLPAVGTVRITSISSAVISISAKRECAAEPAGVVLPKVACCGNKTPSVALATTAPLIWLAT